MKDEECLPREWVQEEEYFLTVTFIWGTKYLKLFLPELTDITKRLWTKIEKVSHILAYIPTSYNENGHQQKVDCMPHLNTGGDKLRCCHFYRTFRWKEINDKQM